MIGFKAFDKNLKCKEFQFEIGKTYTIEGKLELCKNGFHFCKIIDNVYNYYNNDSRICIVKGIGDYLEDGDKVCFKSIEIIKELTKDDIKLSLIKNNSGDSNSGSFNSGHSNSGNKNSGNYNSGNFNSGNFNSGYSNSGNYNSGDSNSGSFNSGNYNSGNYNSGDRNSGNYNSGNYNSGDRNSGSFNSGYYNSGFFNTNSPNVRLFNTESNLSFDDKIITNLYNINVKPILQWITTDKMTEQEKTDNPSHATTGGFLRNTGKIDWSKLTDQDKSLIKSLPNFNDDIFFEITGIRLLEETIPIIINGKEKQLSKLKAKELGLIE